jgi:hypothetical protein
MHKGKQRSFKQSCFYDNEGNVVKLLYGIYLSWNNIIMIATVLRAIEKGFYYSKLDD